MRRREIDRLYSNSLIAGWAIPACLLTLPLFTFLVLDRFWFVVAILTVIAAIAVCRVAEVPATYRVMPKPEPMLPSPRECSKAVYLFSLLTLVGSVLIIVDQQSSLGELSPANLQQRYVDITLASREGERLGTGLSTIGTMMRSTIYIAIVAMVALSKHRPGFRRTGLEWLALLSAIAVCEIATASRTLVFMCVSIGVIAGFALRHRVIRRLGTLCGLGAIAVLMFSITTNQRFEVTGGDPAFATDIIYAFFDVQPQSLGRWIGDQLGFPIVTGLLYMSHPLPEFSRLVADGSTTVALGGHSLYLVITPLERLVGIEPTLAANSLARRPGMWWGGLGDLYFDFGVGFVLAYPAVVFLMVRVARALRGPDVFSLTVRCMTAAILFCSPFFGVFNAFSFAYLLLLGFAVLNASLRRQPARAVPANSAIEST
jgi:hypothetical protein